MPKLKTHKGAQHRFHITGSGKIMHLKIGKSHLRRKKSGRVKRQFMGTLSAHPSNKARIKRLLPYK